MSNGEKKTEKKQSTILPLKKLKCWVSQLEQGLDALPEDKTIQVMRPAGQACASDLEILCQHYLGRKIVGVKDLIGGWNRLRKERGLEGRWQERGPTVEGIFGECGCPLVHSGMVVLHASRCHCSQVMLETIFSKYSSRPVIVEIKKSIGRGDNTCHFLIHFNKASQV